MLRWNFVPGHQSWFSGKKCCLEQFRSVNFSPYGEQSISSLLMVNHKQPGLKKKKKKKKKNKEMIWSAWAGFAVNTKSESKKEKKKKTNHKLF